MLGAPPAVSLEAARGRLNRFRAALERRGAVVALLHDPIAIRHLTGAASGGDWPAALVVSERDAIVVLFAGGEQPAAVDRQVVLRGTRPDHPVRHLAELADAVRPILREVAGRGATIAVDRMSAPGWVWRALEELVAGVADVGGDLVALRRRKDADELAIIRYNVALAEAAYAAAAEVIRPGSTELEVYGAMSDATARAAGTSAPMGGDFASGPDGGSRGGPPTRRVLREGDSYVIDFWPHLGFYHADMCRTFPVGSPGRELGDAMELVVEGMRAAEAIIGPGVRVSSVDEGVRRVLARRPDLGGGGYFHLTGHGIGLEAHEAPWLASEADEVFQVGDVVAVEPGLYAESLNGGVRIEDNYLVVEGGVENLCRFPRLPGA